MPCPRMLLVAILVVGASSFAFACNTKSTAPSGVGPADAAALVTTAVNTTTTTTTGIDTSHAPAPAPAVSSSAPARTADGLLTITGRESHAIHSHGGPPATLEQATFEIDNRGSRSRRVEALAIEYMRSHACDVAPSDVVSRPSLTSFAVRAEAAPTVRSDVGATAIVVEARSRVVVAVRFQSVSATYTHCNRFAFRVAFKVDRETAFATAETSVEREED